MILELLCEYDTPNGMNISYQFVNKKNSAFVASATDNYNQPIILEFNDNQYVFSNTPKIVPRVGVKFKYPLTATKRKKTIGFHINKCNEDFGFFYGEAAKCKKGIFCTTIGFKVFFNYDNIYLLFRVGFKSENSHYYCLYDNNNSLIAVIERHNYYDNNCKATIYVEDKEYVEITLLASVEELISVPNAGGQEFSMDTSAGHYISVLEEEKSLFDKNFILRIKAMDGILD